MTCVVCPGLLPRSQSYHGTDDLLRITEGAMQNCTFKMPTPKIMVLSYFEEKALYAD